MFRNQYDTDVTVWSPEGRLLQVRAKARDCSRGYRYTCPCIGVYIHVYRTSLSQNLIISLSISLSLNFSLLIFQTHKSGRIRHGIRQTRLGVGVRSSSLCVLGALKRAVSELSSHQKKLLEVDDHMACGIAGLTADARSLAKYMRSECLQHKYVYGTPLPPHQLMADLADKHQRTTQTYVRRPFGVGLLVASVDGHGQPHLYQTCPSGNLYEFEASAIGARSQSARTYLEKHAAELKTCSKDQLIVHALQALVGCVSGDDELTVDNGSIAIVGKDQPVLLIEGKDLKPYLDQLEVKGDDDEEEEEKEEEDEPQAMET